MTILKRLFLGASLLLALNVGADSSPPQFREVYDLLRTNLTGVGERELNRAAVYGLVDQLSPKVTLVDDKDSHAADTNSPVALKATVFESAFGYLRLGQFGEGAD